MFCLLPIEPILALGLCEFVDLCSCEPSNKLLSEGVGYGLACRFKLESGRDILGTVTDPPFVDGPRKP